MRRYAASVALILGALMSALPAAAVTICGVTATPEQETSANGLVTTGIISSVSQLSCLNVAGLDASDRSRSCVSSITCEGGADVQCCAAGTGGRAGTGGTGAEPTAGGGAGFFRLALPACTASGNCTVDDIVRTGVNFANFLFGISGAILLATFVYGGVLYITAGSGGNVSKAKDMIKNALIGMILVFGAGALVTTVYDTFRSDTGGRSDSCAAAHAGFSCQSLSADPADATAVQSEITTRGCFRGLCAGSETRVCCPESAP